MPTKEALIARIPRYSGGRFKGEQGKYLHRLLNTYRYNDRELGMFEVEINNLVEHYGHAGAYMPGHKKFARQ